MRRELPIGSELIIALSGGLMAWWVIVKTALWLAS